MKSLKFISTIIFLFTVLNACEKDDNPIDPYPPVKNPAITYPDTTEDDRWKVEIEHHGENTPNFMIGGRVNPRNIKIHEK